MQSSLVELDHLHGGPLIAFLSRNELGKILALKHHKEINLVALTAGRSCDLFNLQSTLKSVAFAGSIANFEFLQQLR